MGFSGRPSKACGRCRTRRLRCDLQQPSCSQCHKIRAPCPGYRNEADLMFKDQTQAVIQKHAHLKTDYHEQLQSQLDSIDLSQTQEQGEKTRKLNKDPGVGSSKSALLLHTPSTPVADSAISFYLTTFLDGSSFHYIPHMYQATSPGSMFSTAVQALALASYSHEVCQPKILEMAQSSYNKVIFQLKIALSDQIFMSADETLASVLILSRFETLANGCDEDVMSTSWSQHILGALAILNVRTPEANFSNPISKELFLQTANNVNLHCIKTNSRRPQSLVSLELEMMRNERLAGNPWDHQSHRLRFHVLTDLFCEFQRCIKGSLLTDPNEIINWARLIDDRANILTSDLLIQCRYKSFTFLDDSGKPRRGFENAVLHRDVYHVYKSHTDAQVWNMARMVRLTLQNLVLKNLRILWVQEQTSQPQPEAFEGLYYGYNQPNHEIDIQITQTQALMSALVDDICASTPQFLRKGYPDCNIAACYFLVWPLYVAARAVPGHCADFAKNRLEYIGTEMKIPSASLAAARLEAQGYRDDWLYACHSF